MLMLFQTHDVVVVQNFLRHIDSPVSCTVVIVVVADGDDVEYLPC